MDFVKQLLENKIKTEKKIYDKSRHHIKKQKYYFVTKVHVVKAISSSHV